MIILHGGENSVERLKSLQTPKHELTEFFPKRNKYCIGIPVINEGEKIRKQLARLKRYSQIVDILIFDGGSVDGSLDHGFLRSKKIRALLVKKEKGKQGTQLRIGCAYALKEGYKGIILMDGNNKDSLEPISRFIKALDEGYGYVQGSRFIPGGKHKNTPLSRILGIRLVHAPLMSLAAGKWYTDTTNGFRALSREYLLDRRLDIFRDEFISYEFYFYTTISANRLGHKTKEIPVTRVYPKGQIPTKINGIVGNIKFLMTTIGVALGKYKNKAIKSG